MVVCCLLCRPGYGRFEHIPNLPSFIQKLVDKLAEKAGREVESKRRVHPVIESDQEAVNQLERCGVKVIRISESEVWEEVRRTLDQIEGADQCPSNWNFPRDVIEKKWGWQLSHVISESGVVRKPRFLFVPGAPLDWEPLWRAGYLSAPYMPVHPLYRDKTLLSRYGLTENDINYLLMESGVHGFKRDVDRELVEEVAYRVAEEQLKKKGHNPVRVTAHTQLGYDYECQGHCNQVFEVKGMGNPRDIILEGAEAKAVLDKKDDYVLICVYNLPCPPSQIGYKEIVNPQSIGLLTAEIIIRDDDWLTSS